MLYFKFLKMHFKKLLQYRLSFALSLIAQTLTSTMMLVAMYFLFDRFNAVKGWTFSQVAISYSIVFVCFSFTECFFRGVDQFSKCVKSGSLDAMFTKPRGILHQVICSDVEFSKLGRLLVSLIVLAYACSIQPFTWTALKIIEIILMMVCGVFIFLALFLLGAAFSIFTIEGTEVVNIFTDGGRELCQYPVDIYGDVIKKIFTYIIPFACFNYLPMKFIFDMPNVTLWGNILAPIYGMLFIVPAYIIFRLALKKYNSTGT